MIARIGRGRRTRAAMNRPFRAVRFRPRRPRLGATNRRLRKRGESIGATGRVAPIPRGTSRDETVVRLKMNLSSDRTENALRPVRNVACGDGVARNSAARSARRRLPG